MDFSLVYINGENVGKSVRLVTDRRAMSMGREATRDVPIDDRWHGFVCFTRRLTPAIGRLDEDPSVFFAFGYHGNGVNTAVWSGKQLARWRGKGKRPALPPPVLGMPRRFPLPALRRHYLGARIGWLGLLDHIGA